METIDRVLDAKGRDVHSIAASEAVFAAIELMAAKSIGALLVTQREDPIGIISERDYARKVILKGKSSRDTKIAEIMSSPVIFARPDMTVGHCMAIMTEKRIRHLPVESDGDVVGIVSLGDLVKSVIQDQQFVIDQLERYITGH